MTPHEGRMKRLVIKQVGVFAVESPLKEVFGTADIDDKDHPVPFYPCGIDTPADGVARINGVSFQVAHLLDVPFVLLRLGEIGNSLLGGLIGDVGCCRIVRRGGKASVAAVTAVTRGRGGRITGSGRSQPLA